MIRLTFVASSVRGAPDEVDTDHVGEALAEVARKWYRSGDHPREASVIAVVIERDDHRLSRDEIAARVKDIAEMEEHRAYSESVRGAS